jgi:hypothetical protein
MLCGLWEKACGVRGLYLTLDLDELFQGRVTTTIVSRRSIDVWSGIFPLYKLL